MVFHLSFPDQRGAKKTVGLLEDAGWTVETSFDGERWLITASNERVSAGNLRDAEEGLRAIAADFGGQYDGSELDF